MICAHMLVPQEGIDEFVPMALREVRCQLRSSNPEKYTRILRNMGEAADPENCECPRNHLGDWKSARYIVHEGWKPIGRPKNRSCRR